MPENTENEKVEQPSLKKEVVDYVLSCPICGSKNIHVDKRGYDAGGACCGAILLGPLGLLCGQKGANKLVKTCLYCGNKF